MSAPIFAPAAAAIVEPVIALPRQTQHRRRGELEPGLRLFQGRVFYSAAWLDQAARPRRSPDADAHSAGRSRAGRGG